MTQVIDVKDVYIPENYIMIIIEKKKDFIKWAEKALIYRRFKENQYSFYVFGGDGSVAVYEQEGKEL